MGPCRAGREPLATRHHPTKARAYCGSSRAEGAALSARVDAERREASRLAAVMRGRGILGKLERILVLYDDGRSDGEIAEVIGWDAYTVMRYRQVLQLSLGRPSGGSWWRALKRVDGRRRL